MMKAEQTFSPPSLTLLRISIVDCIGLFMHSLIYFVIYSSLLYSSIWEAVANVYHIFIACLKVSKLVLINPVLKMFSSIK